MDGRKLLVLDPGHGGSAAAGGSSPNRGVGANGLLEKDLTLDLARRVRDRLLNDHTVVLTRDSDMNLSLSDRATSAKNLGADLFVSIHLSGSPTPGVERTDAVVARDASPRSRELAQQIRRSVAEVTGATGDLLEADLGQLATSRHGTGTAACLIEVASLDTEPRAAQLADTTYRDRIADALASAIRDAAASPMTPLAAPQWVGATVARSTAIVQPEIDYSATGIAGAVAIWVDWLSRYAQWVKGVPNESLSHFPHAAICQLKLYNAAGDLAFGTGFYIKDEVLLTCGHNFYDSDWLTTRVEVQPAYSPTASVLPSATFNVDGARVVHPKWKDAQDRGYDLAVVQVPGLPAQRGVFSLANMSLAQSAGIVVCGYGKMDGAPYENQGQRMDGAHISEADFDLVYYPIQTIGGHSGSPVFHGSMVIGVHTGPRIRGGRIDAHQNRAVLLTPDKEDWIVSMAGPGVTFGLGLDASLGARTLTDSSSTQAEQSDEVRRRIARSLGLAETGLRYDLVHDDSARINFGIGSWTGTRIADLLDTYEAFATEQGRTADLYAHFGAQATFNDVRTRFRTNGIATTLTAAERAMLAALGGDANLQGAQDRHEAQDIRADLDAIGNTGNPWYPFIDGGMGAISEIAAHVLVHARHQAGGAGLRTIIGEAIAHFGGDATLGAGMVAGTITERDVLDQVVEGVVRRVQPQYRTGVRNRYTTLFNSHGASDLSYYFTPAS